MRLDARDRSDNPVSPALGDDLIVALLGDSPESPTSDDFDLVAQSSPGPAHHFRRAHLGVVIVAYVLLLSPPAFGQLLTSVHSRTAAMADAATARADAQSAIVANPAMLAELDGTSASVGTQAAVSRLWWAQTDRPRQRVEQQHVGLGLTFAARLPGPAPLRRLRLGLDLYTPPSRFIRLDAPGRRDIPTWPMYGQRLDHMNATAVAGLELTEHLAVGAGISIRPILVADTFVHYEAGRGETTQENVVVNADRSLRLGRAALLGLAVAPSPRVTFGASYREPQDASIIGRTRVSAGSVVIEDELDFRQGWNPGQVAFGTRVRPVGRVTASADLVWARWSAFRTIRNEIPDPAFRDVVTPRVGAEWTVSELVRLRGGYAFERSPVPDQVADSNLLDASRHVLALGSGFDLAALGIARVAIDLHVRAHLLQPRRWTKTDDSLADADPDKPGKQIDNLGYPGIEAGGQFWQSGLSFVFTSPASDAALGKPTGLFSPARNAAPGESAGHFSPRGRR